MTVYLVGAGPGDPGLITVRGAALLARADVVVHDRLVHEDVINLAMRAERISVGKVAGGATVVTQDAINALLVERGRAGLEVVRLKGGDPFVFGRGGEEAAALAAAGVALEVVPGVSAAIAAPAYAGIPVTLRQEALSFTVVTGHEDPSAPSAVDWAALARTGGTLVVLMGAARAAAIATRLADEGVERATPVAIIEWGTYPRQRAVRTTVGELARGDLSVSSPATIVVGGVVAAATPWFRPPASGGDDVRGEQEP